MNLIFSVGLIVCCWVIIKVFFYVWCNVIRAKPFKWKTNGGQYWAVITGATDGIGYEYARQLGQKGYNLMLISRSQEKLDQTRQTILRETPTIMIETLALDFGHSNIYDRIQRWIEPKLNDIYILINNVGMTSEKPMFFYQHEDQFLHEIINVNMVAATKMTKMILPTMIQCQRGLIVFVSSFLSLAPIPMVNIYGATKAYVDYLARSIMQECLPNKVLIFLFQPGFVSTKMIYSVRNFFFRLPTTEEYVRQSLTKIKWSNCMESSGYGSHAIMEFLISSNIFLFSRQTFALLGLNFFEIIKETTNKEYQTEEEKRKAIDVSATRGLYYLCRTVKNSFFS